MIRFMAFCAALAAASISTGARADLCTNPAVTCGKLISPQCQRLGAGSQDTGCETQFTEYRDCLSEVAAQCGGATSASDGSCSSAEADKLWAEAKADNDCFGYEAFVTSCPNNRFANFARARMARLQCAAPAQPAAATPAQPAEPSSQPVAAQPQPTPPAEPAGPTEAEIRAAQTELRRLRLYRGPIDGDWGRGSQAAMRAFKGDAGLSPADGEITEAALAALRAAPTPEAPEPVAAASPTASRRAGEVFKDCPECPEMVAIPGGSLMMGSPESEPERDSDEGPQRRVTVRPFAMGKYEVTFDEWDACVSAGGCSHRPATDWGRGRQPVMRVSWNDAQAYVAWLNRKVGAEVYRLPSEAEWEYAARAGTSTPFWWGSSITTRQANYRGTSSYNGSPKGEYRKRTVAVGSFSPNQFGLYDVHGNVWEWAQDCWNGSYRGAPSSGDAWMSGDCSMAVLRGGSWNYPPRNLRSAGRVWFGRALRSNSVGFRVARVSRSLRE